MSAPVNGQISECSRTLESTCSFTCNPGYVLDRGTTTRTCQNNAQWDGSEAFCAGKFLYSTIWDQQNGSMVKLCKKKILINAF